MKLAYIAVGLNVAALGLVGMTMLRSNSTIEPQFSATSIQRPVVQTSPLELPIEKEDQLIAVEQIHTPVGDMSMMAVLGHMVQYAAAKVPFEKALEVGQAVVKNSKSNIFTVLATEGEVEAAEPFDAKNQIGAQAPLGYWDPLGLLKGKNNTPERFERLRTVELKHGRIAMLAVLGHILTTSGMRWPGEIAFGLPYTEIPDGLAAFGKIPLAGTLQIIAFIGAIELGYSEWKKEGEEWAMSVFDTSDPSISPESKEQREFLKEQKMAIELNNGRAAQMGILALMVHEKLDNNPYIINSILGAPVPFNQ